MLESENRAQLPLAASAAGCGCCSPEPSFSPSDTGAVEFTLEGLTGVHRARTVAKAVSALEGVESATVELVPGGRFRLVVAGKATAAAVDKAVVSAGYTLTSN